MAGGFNHMMWVEFAFVPAFLELMKENVQAETVDP
jgi:hypothetical protein